MNQMKIKKDGILERTYFDSDKGDYKTQDVTKAPFKYLFEPCTLDKDVTLKDIFLLLNSHIEFYDLVLGNWCKEIVETGLSNLAPSDTELEYLELYWFLNKDYDEEDKETLYGGLFPSLHGVGYKAKEDIIDKWGTLLCLKGERVAYGLTLTNLSALMNLPVILKDELSIFDSISPTGETLLSIATSQYSLGHILHGLLWELSWHGSPSDAEKFAKELNSIIESIDEEKYK